MEFTIYSHGTLVSDSKSASHTNRTASKENLEIIDLLHGVDTSTISVRHKNSEDSPFIVTDSKSDINVFIGEVGVLSGELIDLTDKRVKVRIIENNVARIVTTNYDNVVTEKSPARVLISNVSYPLIVSYLTSLINWGPIVSLETRNNKLLLRFGGILNVDRSLRCKGDVTLVLSENAARTKYANYGELESAQPRAYMRVASQQEDEGDTSVVFSHKVGKIELSDGMYIPISTATLQLQVPDVIQLLMSNSSGAATTSLLFNSPFYMPPSTYNVRTGTDVVIFTTRTIGALQEGETKIIPLVKSTTLRYETSVAITRLNINGTEYKQPVGVIEESFDIVKMRRIVFTVKLFNTKATSGTSSAKNAGSKVLFEYVSDGEIISTKPEISDISTTSLIRWMVELKGIEKIVTKIFDITEKYR